MNPEIQSCVTELREMWDHIKEQLDGLPQEALDWKPVQAEGDLATNSLGAIATHVAGSGRYLIQEVVGGKPVNRNRDAEFAARGTAPAQLKARLEEALKGIEGVLSSIGDKEMGEDRKYRDKTAKVRQIILHVINHTGQHLGHMQLTRQLWLAAHPK